MLVSTFFSMWFAIYFQDVVENAVAYFLILSLGILHGTNDLKLIQKTYQFKGVINFIKILFIYISLVISGILLFNYLPLFMLSVFILFSAYHFGEQYWHSKMTDLNLTTKVFYISYGLTVLFLLLAVNYHEANIIIENIIGTAISTNIYVYLLPPSAFLFLFFSIKLYLEKKMHSSIVEEFFYLLVFYIIFQTTSLLWGFAIYFIFWHSIPSLTDQVSFLYGNTTKKSFIKYLKSSVLYWSISILGLALLYLILRNNDKLFLSVFFTLMAAITFPHVWVMSKLNK